MTCKNGHEWTPETTYINPVSGWKGCKLCIKISQKKHREMMAKGLKLRRGRVVK